MFKAPRKAHLPHLLTMLENIQKTDAEIAKYLEITPETLRKYRAKGQAPRMVMLALFWETFWGQEAVNCDAMNFGRLMRSGSACLNNSTLLLSEILGAMPSAFEQTVKLQSTPHQA